MKRTVWLVLAVSMLAAGSRAEAAIRITEWMYQGANGEFVEFTNLGATPVDVTGWSYSDSARAASSVPLGVLGTIAAGESFILTESPAASFRTAWGLSDSVKVLGDNTVQNLGRGDEINIYDASSALVDRLTYGDVAIPGSIRTQNQSGIPSSPAALGANNVMLWQLAANGDSFGSRSSAQGDQGSPGFYAVPEPTTVALAGLGGLSLAMARRKVRVRV